MAKMILLALLLLATLLWAILRFWLAQTDALREEENRNTLLIQSIRDYAVFRIDLQGRIQSWTKESERLEGYRTEDIIGKHFSILYTDEDREARKPELELETALRDGRYEDIGWRVRKDGSRLWANVVVSLIRDRHGKPLGFVKVTRNLTERKKIEELEEVVAMRDEFLSIASHELKTPVTSLQLRQQHLKRIVARLRQQAAAPGTSDSIVLPTLKHLDHNVAASERSTDSLVRLLEDLLDVSRFRVGKFEVNPERNDLTRLAKAAIASLSEDLRRRGVQVSLKTRPQQILGEWDARRIRQLLSNLLTNAIKYGEGRPVDVTIEAQGEPPGTAVIRVSDRGMGIPREFVPRLFQRFERAVPSAKISGLGLGLYIVRLIAEAHGGSVSVESVEGKGSTFTVRLPIAFATSQTKVA